MYGLAILLVFSGAGIIFVEGKFNKPFRAPSVKIPWGSVTFLIISGIWLGLVFLSTIIFWLSLALRSVGLDSVFALAPERLSTAVVSITVFIYIIVKIIRRRLTRTVISFDNPAPVMNEKEVAGEGSAGNERPTLSASSAESESSAENESLTGSKGSPEGEGSASSRSAFNKKPADTCTLGRRKTLLSSLADVPPKYLLILAIAAGIFAFWLLHTSFRESNGYLQAGASVFSDMAPHTALASSFAKGANIPPDYPHFAADGIRYHFFFYHLAGLLHAGGISLALALNLLTWLGIVSFIMLLGLLAWRLTATRGAILLAPFLAMFRSSCAFFTFLASVIIGQDNMSWGQKLLTHTAFIGNTPREDWGLWSINVYANQRHLPAALTLLLILLLLQTDSLHRGRLTQGSFFNLRRGEPLVSNRADTLRFRECSRQDKSSRFRECSSRDKSSRFRGRSLQGKSFRFRERGRRNKSFRFRGRSRQDKSFRFRGHSRQDKSFRYSAMAGRRQQIITVIILFLLPFWHGSVFLAALMLLFCYALISDNKFSLLSGATLGLLYAFLQSKIFSTGAPLPQNIFHLGFISEDTSLRGVLAYILELTGILLPILIIVFIVNRELRLWIAISSLPFIFSFLFSLTPDVTVNHKLIMISIILWSIPLAKFLLDLPRLSVKRLRKAFLCLTTVLLILVLTVSGLYECLVFRNLSKIHLAIPISSELCDWIEENTAPDAIFLTAPYSYNKFFLSGRRAWYGHPYYAWSAGHDTLIRESQLYSLTASSDPVDYKNFFEAETIDAILVDDEMRRHPDFPLNEEIIAALFPLAASFADEDNSRIYVVNDALLSPAPIHR